MGRAARPRRRELSQAARLPLRALRLLSGQAGHGGTRLRRGHGRARRDRAAPSDGEARAAGDVDARQPDRRPSLRVAFRDRTDLLDERHHRGTQLHPVDGGRPRQLDHRLGAQLRGLRNRRRPADRLDLQRRTVRGGCGAGIVRANRPLPHPRRHRQHGAGRGGDRAAPAGGGRAHTLVRRLPRGVDGRAGSRSPASPAAASRPSGPSSRRVGARR
jgi:hypothetical protein